MVPDLPTNEIVFRAVTLLTVLGITATGAIASLNNVSAPGINLQFIKHIMSMDTTYQAERTRWRSVNSPLLQWTAFVFIIICEALVGIFGCIGSIQLMINFTSPEAAWEAAKLYCYLSLGMALFVWFFIFQVVGAEWFESWQSENWNGIRDSIRINLMTAAGIIILRLS